MSVKPTASFETLAQIKSIEERAAAERLNAARERLENERLKLTTVQRYLVEYREQGSGPGPATRLLAERHRFRLELEQGVETQSAAVERAEAQAESAREHWASLRAEREAMQKLVERREAEALQRALRADQRQSDEQALGRAGKGEGTPAA